MYNVGDVSYIRGNSQISDWIILFQRLRDRPGWNPFVLGEADATHVWVHDTDNKIVEALTVGGITKRDLSVYAGKDFDTFRFVGMTDVIRKNMRIMMELMVGQMYGYGKIGLLALDSVFRTYWFSRRMGSTERR